MASLVKLLGKLIYSFLPIQFKGRHSQGFPVYKELLTRNTQKLMSDGAFSSKRRERGREGEREGEREKLML